MYTCTSFASLAKLCADLEKTRKRLEKKRLIAEYLKKLEKREVQPAVSFILGKPFPESDERELEVGGAILWKVERSKQTTLIQEPLTILGVAKTFEKIASASGPGSRLRKESLLTNMYRCASDEEARYLTRLLMGEMRIGAVEGVVLEAIAEACNVKLELVQRANMLLGNLGKVAEIALFDGRNGLEKVGLRLFHPVKPMLAKTSYNFEEVIDEYGGVVAFEWKVDGARVQIHKKGNRIRVFSRRLTDVTESVPDIVSMADKGIRLDEALVEGEVVAVDKTGRPLPFQDLMRRFRRIKEVDETSAEIPLKLYLFDILYCNGQLLIDKAYSTRWSILEKSVDQKFLVPRIVTSNVEEAEAFLRKALAAGQEGLMAKRLDGNYTAGVRGGNWYKIKPFESLDLVIIAADWGSGRRRGWLSNYHLGARVDETDRFVCLGKTFKGLTDEEFTTMTKRLQELKIHETPYTVYVKPRVVVEVAYNEIQRSNQYESGFALRFARIVRIRDDKDPAQVDTLSRIKELYEQQFKTKGMLGPYLN
ncbi:MAG: ATP-dependent DNA ligase [Candidatus Bathyarchaeia archaeon]